VSLGLRQTVIQLIQVVKKMLNLSYKEVCHSLEFGYSTFMRWKGRMKRSKPLVKKPGPRKEIPLELNGLMDRIRSLEHRKKRSFGTGHLFEEYKDQVSRRDFHRLVRAARADMKREKASQMRRIEWKQPGLVWAMDDTFFGYDQSGKKLFVHSTRDLPSRYQFDPLSGNFTKGPEVAKHLRRLFNRYGSPLFLKRDNGGNLNHAMVEQVLSDYWVIPLNSPRYYPPYNGAIEKAQKELKDKIRMRLAHLWTIPRKHFQVYGESAAYDLNHLPRRSLKGKVPCQIFFTEKGGVKFSKRKRREIFEWIKQLSYAIMVGLGKSSKRAADAAWRMAVESWLQVNGYINVSMGW